MKVRYAFLDGMKAIVCLFVFLGHFFVDFCITDIFPMNSLPYRACLLVFYGCYTVPLFCAISGFLVVQKELSKGWELVLAVLNRFLRFELPIFVAVAAVMLLNRRGLFAYGDLLAQRLLNGQLAGNYTFESHYTWLFRKPFWGFQPYDDPLWMIGSLFAGNIALYCYGYASSLCLRFLKGWTCTAVRAACMILLFTLARHDIPMLAVLLGGCYGLLRRACAAGTRLEAWGRRLAAAGCAICIPLVILNLWLYFVRDFDYEHFTRGYEWAGLLTALGILHLAFTVRAVQGFLSCRPLTAARGLSFAVYIVHYPLIGLVACPVIYGLWDRLPYVPLVLLAFAATVLVCAAVSFAFSRLVEKPCSIMVQHFIGFLREN